MTWKRPRMLSLPRDGWEAVHKAATGIMAWWSLVLAFHRTTFDVGAAYQAMSVLGTEGQWSITFGICAAIGVWGVETDTPRVKQFSCLVVSMAHTAIALLGLFAAGITTGTGTYLFIALLAIGSFSHAGRAILPR